MKDLINKSILDIFIDNSIFKIKCLNDNEFRYMQFLSKSSSYISSTFDSNTLYIHFLNIKTNKECYIKFNYIIEIEENDLKEFE